MSPEQILDIEHMAKAIVVEQADTYQLRRENVPVFTVPKDEMSYRNLLIYASRYQFYLKIHNEIEFLLTR